MRKVTLVSVIAMLATLVAAVPGFASAEPQADGAAEQRSLSLINGERSSRGLGTLRWSTKLAQIARDHSFDMARRGELYHNDDLGNQVEDWRTLGENVGVGPDADSVHGAFMDSTEHRANILGHDYTQAGIGAVVDDGSVWITEVFVQPDGTRTTTTTTRPAKRAAPSPSRYLTAAIADVHGVRPATPAPKDPAQDEAVAALTVSMLQAVTDETVVPQQGAEALWMW